jgi:hypothetical protein
MNSLKDYIKLYRKFKTDSELAHDTGLSEQEVRAIKRQLNLEALCMEPRHALPVKPSRASKNSRLGAKTTPVFLPRYSKTSVILRLSFLLHRK